VIATFKTRGKVDGKYIRHAYVSDSESDPQNEFAICSRNELLDYKPTSTLFLSKKGDKVRSDRIGVNCKRCEAIVDLMKSRNKQFKVVEEAVSCKS